MVSHSVVTRHFATSICQMKMSKNAIAKRPMKIRSVLDCLELSRSMSELMGSVWESSRFLRSRSSGKGSSDVHIGSYP